MSRFANATLLLAVCLVCVAGFALSACETTGRITGQVVQEIKEMPDEFSRGYDTGAEEAKNDG